MESAIVAGLADSPVVVMAGARQTGKSTLIQSPAFQKQDRRFLTFDDANILAAAKAYPAGFINSYLTTILQRDVRDLSNIEDITAVPRLLSILAARAGGLLNTADVSRSSGIAQTTLKRHLSLLETIFLLQLLPAWSGNFGKRFVKMPKVFLSDSALAADLLNLTLQRVTAEPGAFGPLLENFVAQELRKQAAWSAERPQLFHWRTHMQHEVDLVMEAGGRVVGIEVKASSTVTSDDFKGLKAFAVEAKGQFIRGVVLDTGQEMLPFGENLLALPVSALWRLGL